MKYASIIVDISHEKLDKPFTYGIPGALENQVTAGTAVEIPFGKGNRLITGYVIDFPEKIDFPEDRIKLIASVLDKNVTMESELISLAFWIRKNYGGTINQALKTVLPVKTKIQEKLQITVCLNQPKEEVKKLLCQIGTKRNMLARVRLLKALLEEPKLSKEYVRGQLHISDSTLNKMEELGLIVLEKSRVWRNPAMAMLGSKKEIHLNEVQRKVFLELLLEYQKEGPKKPQLLFGVTGSGKTEIYLKLIEEVMNQGKQAIVLIPEIALTYQILSRFYERFGDQVGVIHSKMSVGERYDQMLRAEKGDLKVMVGPRSALFTPFTNLGLIVIDEEHDQAYKSEGVPKYHARETAIYRANKQDAMVVLGSATPSLNSFYQCQKGNYKLHQLPVRAGNAQPAKVELVDLRKELREGNRSMFSKRLKDLILDRLEKKEQVILFLNRRGYSRFVSCRNCGEAVMCPHCSVAMTLHRNPFGKERLVCHYCGHEMDLPKECPNCASPFIGGFGTGTQQVEDMVKKQFPMAKVLRMDLDTTKGKEGAIKILEAFAGGEADILIGTQMIVKGHDFPNVTLVGILAADLSLFAPDFMASEKTFDLLTQACGRAGRGRKPGIAVIQTYNPEHYAIVTSKNQDYKSFYKEEIAYRKILKYPPVFQMLSILISGKKEELVNQMAIEVGKSLQVLEGDYLGYQKIGPVDARVAKINDVYRKVIYIKAENHENLLKSRDLAEGVAVEKEEYRKYVSLQFDFSPMGGQ